MASLRDFLQIGAVALGVDIGKSAIKAVELRRTARGIEVHRVGVVATPDGAIEGGHVLNRDAVARTLGALLHQTGIRHRKAVISVTGQDVLARILRLPPIPEEEVKQAIRWEAERHLPFPVDEAVLDVQIVGEVSEDGQRQIEVLLAAAPERLVLAHIETMAAARLFVEAAEVGALAMARAVEFMAGSGTRALVNLGASTTDVAIIRDGVPQFTRTIPMGSDVLTETLADHLALDHAKAEEIKIRHGMGWETAPGPEGTYAAAVAAAMEEFINQVRRSLDFYRAQFGGTAVDGVVLCGGGARLRHLDHHLTNELELPVVIGAPFANMQIPPGADRTKVTDLAPQLVVATGLALRIVA